MPRKKNDEVEQTVSATDEAAIEAAPAEEPAVEAAPVEETVVEAADAPVEKPRKSRPARTDKAEKAADAAGAVAKAVHKRAEKVGIVASDKMTKTVTVLLERRFAHPVYGKQVTRSKSIKARNELGARAGDTVRIMETRPLAKTVHWRVAEIVARAK